MREPTTTRYEPRVRALCFFFVLVCLGLSLPRASAQDAAADARSHFTRGVALYDEGRAAQALAEFREAQRISPSSVILYNIAQVEAELGHAVESVAAYEELLASARSIESSMRSQIDSALAEQRARIATLRVETNAPGAIVAVDDVDVGAAPLAGVRVSAGEHVVTARANGYETIRYRFIVAGGATHDANLTLVLSGAAIGSLRVDARVPGIEIVVDGVPYGITPLASAIALPAGSHHVEGRRPAYSLFAQDVTVAPASEARTTVVVEPDPSAPSSQLGMLRLSVPAASSSLRIDGASAELAASHQMTLPGGLHDIEVHVADREPFATRVDVLPAETYDLRPPYVWTPEARETRVSGARTQSQIGLGLIIGGAIAAVAGGAMTIAVWADYQSGRARITDAYNTHCFQYQMHWMDDSPTFPYAQGCVDALHGLYDLGPFTTDMAGRHPPDVNNVAALGASTASALSTYYTEIGIGAAIAALGGIALISGIVLVAITPDEGTIDRSARATAFRLELSGGPNALTLRGVF